MLNRLFSRRAVVTGAAAATAAAAAVPAIAIAAHRPEPDPAGMEGMATMHLDGRRLLVDLNRMPAPGDEVVALVSESPEATRVFAVFTTASFLDPHHHQHGARRVYWDCIGRTRVGEAVGVVIGGPAHA